MYRLCRFFLSVFVVFAGASNGLAQTSPSPIVQPEVQLERSGESQDPTANIRHAATSLQMDPQHVQRASEALNLVYARDYRGARTAFSELHKEHPELALGNVGRMLIFQCLMLENFDFRYEKMASL